MSFRSHAAQPLLTTPIQEERFRELSAVENYSFGSWPLTHGLFHNAPQRMGRRRSTQAITRVRYVVRDQIGSERESANPIVRQRETLNG